MRTKSIILVVAIMIGLTAAYMVTVYLSGVRKQLEVNKESVKIMVTVDNVPMGLTLSEMKDQKLVAVKKVPKGFLTDGALKEKADLKDKVSAFSMEKGEQLTLSKFRTPSDAGLAFMIPADYVAISIPADEVKAMPSMIKIGDFINVIVTIEENNQTTSRTMLQRVRVLAVGTSFDRETKTEGGSNNTLTGGRERSVASGKKNITLAVTPADAEKLVLAEEQGQVWLTLMSSPEAKPAATSGQTVQTMFNQ